MAINAITNFVIDSSVVLDWLFAGESSGQSLNVQNLLVHGRAIASQLFVVEVTDALAKAEKENKITESQSEKFLKLINRLPIIVRQHSSNNLAFDLIKVCRKNNLNGFEAACLDLALKEHIPLATSNKKIIKVATALDIELL